MYHACLLSKEFESAAMVELCETLRRLSTESHKYWAKRDRRHQKSSFRDILRAVQVTLDNFVFFIAKTVKFDSSDNLQFT